MVFHVMNIKIMKFQNVTNEILAIAMKLLKTADVCVPSYWFKFRSPVKMM